METRIYTISYRRVSAPHTAIQWQKILHYLRAVGENFVHVVGLPRSVFSYDLQDYSLVSDAARHALTVEVLEKRNGVLTGYADEVFESDDIHLRCLALLRDDELTQTLEC